MCMLIVLAVYSYVSRPHMVVYRGVVDSRFENFHLDVNDNFLQDEGGGMSGPLRADPWHGRILVEYGSRIYRHRPIADPIRGCHA